MPIPIKIRDNTSTIRVKPGSHPDNVKMHSSCDIEKTRLDSLIAHETIERILGDANLQEQIDRIIDGGFKITLCTTAENTPLGVCWYDKHGELIVGTLVATKDTGGVYLVIHNYPEPPESGQLYDTYDEYIAFKDDFGEYTWEKIGSTQIDFHDLAKYLTADVSTSTEVVAKASVSEETLVFTNVQAVTDVDVTIENAE